MTVTHPTVPALDGRPLAATLIEPARPEGPAVLIAPAIGVRRRLYHDFAVFLASRGLPSLTWDWDGIGDSLRGPLRRATADLDDWARRDLAGAIAWMRVRHPDATLTLVGHSFGGQAAGLAPNASELERILLVAVPSGYWGHWKGARALKMAALWYVVLPLSTRLMGYFPARALGLGEALPAPAALQWARWCRSPCYICDYAGHTALPAPVLSLSFADDPYAPRDAVDWMTRRFGGERDRRHIRPEAVGADRLGHLGFFSVRRGGALWEEAAAWLRGSAES